MAGIAIQRAGDRRWNMINWLGQCTLRALRDISPVMTSRTRGSTDHRMIHRGRGKRHIPLGMTTVTRISRGWNMCRRLAHRGGRLATMARPASAGHHRRMTKHRTEESGETAVTRTAFCGGGDVGCGFT